MITRIAEVLIQFIESFLSKDDYHYLMNTSKHHFEDMKRKTIYFTLNEEKSLEYITNDKFQQLLLSKVINGWKQIGIIVDVLQSPLHQIDFIPPIQSLRRYKKLMYFHQLSQHVMNQIERITVSEEIKTINKLKQFPYFPNLKELYIDHFQELEDVSNLSHLKRLMISDADNLTDITPLQNIPFLNFMGCSELEDFSVLNCNKVEQLFLSFSCITDFSAFRNIRSVHISFSHEIEDVSLLYGVYDLSLINNEGLGDISSLGGHHRLRIERCGYHLQGYECLLGIPHVTLDRCDIKDISVLRHAKTVHLTRCQMEDVSPLINVKKVSLMNCYKIQNIFILKDNYELSFNDCGPIDIQWNNYRLKVHRTLKYTFLEFSFIMNLKHLILSQRNEFTRLFHEGETSFFQNLQSLEIHHDSDHCSVKGLGDIPSLTLSHCQNLRDISDLGRNRRVYLSDCPEIRDVQSLATVPVVKIEKCRHIQDYQCLPKVQRIKIIK